MMVYASEPRIIILWFLATLIQLTTSGKISALKAKNLAQIEMKEEQDSLSKLSTSLCMDDHHVQQQTTKVKAPPAFKSD